MPVRPRFLDIHIIQSVPFANLNRDDTNSVKTVLYGAKLRTRVSSQSWKRAARIEFERITGNSTLRTRRICEAVTRELLHRGWPHELAEKGAPTSRPPSASSRSRRRWRASAGPRFPTM
ncbi:hypothetical protein SHKM778_31280 [Streptomyces sp. KM77-8]|uniref:Type I-E CRISPR-associated protein Cas7/Cse4/CasC n=1 Tax=Streptomyces haneummycinicus TaxID=3074435 RepID=A0AAT9HHE3_9ACTN